MNETVIIAFFLGILVGNWLAIWLLTKMITSVIGMKKLPKG